MKTPAKAEKICHWAALSLLLFGSVWLGNANKLLVKTKSGLLEYESAEIHSISFGGDDATPTKQIGKLATVNSALQIQTRQTSTGLQFDIRMRPDTEYYLSLYDLAGNAIVAHRGFSKGADVHFSPTRKLSQGVYLLRLSTSTESIVHRAIKL